MQTGRHDLYAEAGRQFAPTVARLARAFERDAERARDLEQDIHCEIWRSLERFDGRCSLKTWVFRVAHNVAAEHVARALRQPARIAIDQIDEFLVQHGAEAQVADSHALDRVAELIRRLPALDAQLILLWLEGETGQDIAEVTGLSPGAVTTRLHRIRAQLARHFELPATASGQDEGDQR
ncbi:MAG: sigma-70 family RNA polymerase sigma factor [Alphaproteobacteria bacterium]|jgi:RNA polymerase sigma factor (sigma-70 family)|nr:sigma-70 family RNA polymerase sigma factor [Alphaproteobacteria bacterium]MBU1606706.1 sigma-70 family RNA polymerase sigma factor [Alphaproteobacteria bacterium]